MRTLALLLLALSMRAGASEFEELGASAENMQDRSQRMTQLAAAIKAWRTGDNPVDLAFRYYQLGTDYLEANHPKSALTMFDRSLKLSPRQAAVHTNRAHALAKMRRSAEALRDYKEACRLKPDSPLFQTNVCGQLLALDQVKQALPYCQRARKLDPSYDGSAQATAIVYALLGRFDEAKAELRPFPKGVTLANAVVASLEGKAEAGETGFQKALAEEPGSAADTLLWRGRVRLRLDQPDKAMADFTSAYAKDPQAFEALAWRASAHQKAGRRAEATKDRAEACRLGWAPACPAKTSDE